MIARMIPLCLLAAGGLAARGADPVDLKVGDKAPAFQARDDRDRSWDAADRLGKKWVVVYFYPGDFTPGCTSQAKAFKEHMNKLTNLGVEVVGVSGDSAATHAKFKEAEKLNFTLLADEDGSVAKAFGVPFGKGAKVRAKGPDGQSFEFERAGTAARWTFVIGTDGTVAYKNTRVNPGLDAKAVAAFITRAEEAAPWLVRQCDGHTATVTAVALGPDGKHALSASVDGTVRLWDAATGREVRRFAGHDGAVWSAALSPDGAFALSGGRDATVRLWDTATGKEVHTFRDHVPGVVATVAFAPDGKRAVSAGWDKTARVWDLVNRREERQIEFPAPVLRAHITADGRRLVLGTKDGVVWVQEFATRKQIRTLEGHGAPVWGAAADRAGKTVVAGGGRDFIDPKADAATFLRVWDVEAGKEVRRLDGHADGVRTVAVTPDGVRAVTGGLDGTLRVWDLATGKEFVRIPAHPPGVECVAVSSDGRTAVSGGFDYTVRVWKLPE
jgi:WD40 repeat protein